jgi:hypothetical protein
VGFQRIGVFEARILTTSVFETQNMLAHNSGERRIGGVARDVNTAKYHIRRVDFRTHQPVWVSLGNDGPHFPVKPRDA